MRSDALPLSQRSIFVLRPSSTAPQLPSANRGPMGRQTLVQTCEASSASPVPCIVHGRSTWPALPKASRAFHHADFWAAGFGLSIGLMMLSAVCCLRSYFSSLKEVVCFQAKPHCNADEVCAPGHCLPPCPKKKQNCEHRFAAAFYASRSLSRICDDIIAHRGGLQSQTASSVFYFPPEEG